MSLQGSKGEVMFDNRANSAGVQEFWSFTCAHCGTVRYVNPFSGNIVRMRVITKVTPQAYGEPIREPVEVQWREIEPPTVCRKCMKYICDHPACHAECLPVDRGIDLAVAQGKTVSPFAVDDRHRYELHELYESDKKFLGVSLGD
jgi:hypothetical protein